MVHLTLALIASVGALATVVAANPAPAPLEGADLSASYDDGSWHEGKYEGGRTKYDDGKWSADKYDKKYGKHGDYNNKYGYKDDHKYGDSDKYKYGKHVAVSEAGEASWNPDKYIAASYYDDNKYGKYDGNKYGKYDGNKYGKDRDHKYDDYNHKYGKNDNYNHKYGKKDDYNHKYQHAAVSAADDGSWYPGKYEGGDTGFDDGSWSPEKYVVAPVMAAGYKSNDGYSEYSYSCSSARPYFESTGSPTLKQCISIACAPGQTKKYTQRAIYQCYALEEQARATNDGYLPYGW